MESEFFLGFFKDYYIGFVGCMRDILVDYKSFNLLENRNGQSISVIRYCGELQQIMGISYLIVIFN